MYHLNKKQKIIIATIISIVAIAIYYYVYAKEETSPIEVGIEEKQENTNVENKENENSLNNENSTKEESKSTIKIHIAGAVKNEGVIEIKANSRLSDAIEKAGGLKEDADITKINLACLLEDGIKIYIPNRKDGNNINQDETEKYVMTPDENNISIKDTNKDTLNKKDTKIMVNINTATQAELETIPGIGPSTALKIIKYRQENGKFKNIEDIKEVSGIGDSKYNQMKDKIKVK